MNKAYIQKITNYIFLKSRPKPADLALIFGTRHQEALKTAFKLYQQKLVPKILVSGGVNKITGKIEAAEMKNELIKMGVREKDILVENKSTNSLENVLFSKKIIKDELGFKNVKKIIAVCKHYHCRRALMTLKKHFPKTVEFFPATYKIYGFTQNNWWKNEIGKEKVLEEYNKIKKYLEKGDIEEI